MFVIDRGGADAVDLLEEVVSAVDLLVDVVLTADLKFLHLFFPLKVLDV